MFFLTFSSVHIVVASPWVAERPPYVVLCLHDSCEDIISQRQYPVSALYHEGADSAVALSYEAVSELQTALLLPIFISLLLVLPDIINFVTVFF